MYLAIRSVTRSDSLLYLAGKIVLSSLPTRLGDAVIRFFDSKSLHALVRRRSLRKSARRSYHHGRHRCGGSRRRQREPSPEIEEVEAVVEDGDDDPIPLMNVSF